MAKAAAADPGFAMALAKLAVVHANLGDMSGAREYSAKAVERAGNLPPGERYYIEGHHDSLDPASIAEGIELAAARRDELRAGGLEASVLHTPGHTQGSVCLYFPAEKKLLAGDTLFAGSIGRTDLPGGSFDKIMASLHGPVLSLPDETIVVPGHGPLTTVGDERETNPFLLRRS